MKKIGLLVIAIAVIVSLVGCTKEYTFNYRIEYRAYEITPRLAEKRLSMRALEGSGRILFDDLYFTNNYRIQNNELQLTGIHLWTIAGIPLEIDDIFKTTNTPESLLIGEWKETNEAWKGDGATVKEEPRYYIGLYRITAGPYRVKVRDF